MTPNYDKYLVGKRSEYVEAGRTGFALRWNASSETFGHVHRHLGDSKTVTDTYLQTITCTGYFRVARRPRGIILADIVARLAAVNAQVRNFRYYSVFLSLVNGSRLMLVRPNQVTHPLKLPAVAFVSPLAFGERPSALLEAPFMLTHSEHLSLLSSTLQRAHPWRPRDASLR